MPAEEIEQTAPLVVLEELDGSLDELGQLFAVEDDRARLALERLEEDGADLHRLDGMRARVGYRSIIVPDPPADTGEARAMNSGSSGADCGDGYSYRRRYLGDVGQELALGRG